MAGIDWRSGPGGGAARGVGCEAGGAGAGPPQSDFQRGMRNGAEVLVDHVSKEMNEINLERCRCIPTNTPGADWRCLEAIVAADPSRETFKVCTPCTAISNTDPVDSTPLASPSCICTWSPFVACDQQRRAVAAVGVGGRGAAEVRGGGALWRAAQGQSLVPWCLPNTAERHNGWRGLFGRLDWRGHFPTSTTDPQPMAPPPPHLRFNPPATARRCCEPYRS